MEHVTCYDNKGREFDLVVGGKYKVCAYIAEHDAFYLEGVEEKCSRTRFEIDDVVGERDQFRAEITQLRAELAAMTAQADAEALYSDGLRAELEQERELADRLVKQLKSWAGDEPDYHDDAEALTTHATRRNK